MTLTLPERFQRFVDFLYKDRPETREKVYKRMMENLDSVNFTNPNQEGLIIGTATRLSGNILDISQFFLMLETIYKKEQEMEEVQREKEELRTFMEEMED